MSPWGGMATRIGSIFIIFLMGPWPQAPGPWAQGPGAHGPQAQGPWAQGPWAQGPWAQGPGPGPTGAWAQGPRAHGPRAQGMSRTSKIMELGFLLCNLICFYRYLLLSCMIYAPFLGLMLMGGPNGIQELKY